MVLGAWPTWLQVVLLATKGLVVLLATKDSVVLGPKGSASRSGTWTWCGGAGEPRVLARRGG